MPDWWSGIFTQDKARQGLNLENPNGGGVGGG